MFIKSTFFNALLSAIFQLTFLVILMWRILKIVQMEQKCEILSNYRACDEFMWKSDTIWIHKYVWTRLYTWICIRRIYQHSCCRNGKDFTRGMTANETAGRGRKELEMHTKNNYAVNGYSGCNFPIPTDEFPHPYRAILRDTYVIKGLDDTLFQLSATH